MRRDVVLAAAAGEPQALGVIETMDDCCIDKTCAIDRLRERQTATLRIVLLVNAAMFVVELVSGLLAGSVALLAAAEPGRWAA